MGKASGSSADNGIHCNSEDEVREIFAGHRIVSRLLLGVAVMNTFGLACPLLLLCVAGETFSLVLAWRLRLREYVQRKARVGEVDVACRRLESATSSIGIELNTALFMVLVVVGIFWSGFLIDMCGMKYGIQVGGPLAIVPSVALPLLYWSIAHGGAADKISRRITMGIELQPQSNPVLKDQLSLNSSL
jgi:hypothetical protein